MALAATTIWEVKTTGSDTVNAGAFDPGQTAGMLTDGAATSATSSAPVFSSASYNFAAGDVGAWLYVASGTNWTQGWYQIASVAANAATLNASIGQAVKRGGFINTVSGCATTASPTSATWTIDYSQQATQQISYTDLVSVGTGLTVSSVAHPFGKQQVGNAIVITGGTNFNAGIYVIASVATVTATVVGPTNITTGAGASGTGSLGGALATIGKALAVWKEQNVIYVQATASYTVTASVTLASGLNDLPNIAPNQLIGYTSVRTDAGQPTITTATNGLSLITVAMCNVVISNFIVDANGTTTSICVNVTASEQGRGLRVYNVTAKNFTSKGFNNSTAGAILSSVIFERCYATGGTSAASAGFALLTGGLCLNCVARSNSCHGFSFGGNNAFGVFIGCLSASNKTGGGYHGFNLDASLANTIVRNCVAYDNSSDGISVSGTYDAVSLTNNILVSNSGYGINLTVTMGVTNPLIDRNFFYSNGNNVQNNYIGGVHDVILTADPFTSSVAGDFSLNTTTGGGALCRGAGYPGVFPGSLTTGHLDAGAAQHADPASGGETSAVFS